MWNLFRFRAFKRLKPSAAASTRHSGHSYYLGLPQPSAPITAFNLPFAAFKTLKCSAAASTRHAGHSHCYYRRSKLPFARPQRPKTLRDSFDRQLRPGTQAQPSATISASIGVRGCRLPALKGLKPAAAASTRHSGTAVCYYRRSRLPFARPQRPKTLRGSFDQARRPQPSATVTIGIYRPSRLPFARPQRPKTLRASFDWQLRPATQAHSHLLLSAFEAAVCPPSKT